MWKKALLIFVIAIAMIVAGCSSKNDNNETNNNDTNIVNNSENNEANNETNDENNDTNDENNDTTGDNDQGGQPLPIDGNATVSTDETVYLTLSDEWSDDFDLNRGAILASSNRLKEKYTLVLPTSKATLAEGTTLEEFQQMMAMNMQHNIINYDEKDFEKLTINGLNALQYVVTGEVQDVVDVKITYLITLFESDHRFYQLTSWTLPSMYDQYEEEYKAIAQSFVVDPDAEIAAQQVSLEEIEKTYVSPNGDIQLVVPEGWEEDYTVNNPEADFILSSADMSKYLMVIRDLKSDLGESVTLKQYQQLLEQMTRETALEEYEATAPVSLEINGNEALQYEVIGSISGIKLHYLYTIVETDEYFNQILIWSDQASFPHHKELFQSISASYQVD